MNFDETYGQGGLPWWLYGVVQAGTLPTSPKALERAIVRRFEHGHSRPSATFVYAATFLNAGSTAALRAALYRVIESLPGVQNLGPATDHLGRHGQAVGLVTSGTREVLISDSASTPWSWSGRWWRSRRSRAETTCCPRARSCSTRSICGRAWWTSETGIPG